MVAKLDLKQLLTDLEGIDFNTLEQTELVALVYEMLEHLGDTDAELRDGLIHPTIVKIIESGILSEEDFMHLLETIMGERHLFYNLGEKGDSVFMRSFSALIIASLLNADAKSLFLTKADYNKVLDKSIEYIEGEKDTRGYVEGKGWAHAIAHSADLLLALVKHPSFDTKTFPTILETMKICFFKEAAYADAEDRRFILVFKAMQEKGFTDAAFDTWIRGIFYRLSEKFKMEGFSYGYYRVVTNVENFMKSLYFRFKADGESMHLRVLLFDSVKALPHNKTNGNEN